MENLIDLTKYTDSNFLNEFDNYNSVMEKYLFIEYRKVKSTPFPAIDINNINKAEFLELVSKVTIELNCEQKNFYPQSFRQSFFAQIFSLLEYELKEICKIFQLAHHTDFSLNDLKGNSDVEKAKVFLTKAAKINFSQLEPEWNYLNTCRKIRNIFIHHRGEISQQHQDWKTIWQFISKNRLKMGVTNSAECLEKKDFESVYEKDYIFDIYIHDLSLNEELISMVKKFLNKLTLQLREIQS